MGSHLDLHLLLCVAESLADATADLALIADIGGAPSLRREAVALLDALDAQADRLETVIARRSDG